MGLTYVFENEYDRLEVMYNQNWGIEWKTQCHLQPVMEHTGIYVGAEIAEGICRRCGKWGDLTNI